MALITCKECGKEISSDAKTCPHCGKELKKPSILSKKVSGCGCLLLIILIGVFYFIIKASSGMCTSPSPAKTTTQKAPTVELDIQFDIPKLIKMNKSQIKKELGKPISEYKPTTEQLKLDPSFPFTAEYQKGTTNIQIDYSKNGKITSIFISDYTAGRTKGAIMQLGNIKAGSSEYRIRVQKWLNPQYAKQTGGAEIAGIEVTPR